MGKVKYVRGDGSGRVVYNYLAVHKKTREAKVIPYAFILNKGETPKWSFSTNSSKARLLNKSVEIINVGNHWSYRYDDVAIKVGMCFDMDENGMCLYQEPEKNPIRF